MPELSSARAICCTKKVSMAEDQTERVHCLGCGEDLTHTPRDRRNLGVESKGAAEPRERVLSSWTSLLSQELRSQGESINNVVIDLANPGKMCHKCFYECDKYSRLYTQLKDKLHVAIVKMRNPAAVATISTSTASSTPPARKRSLEIDETSLPAQRRVASTQCAYVLASDTASPPVTVCI